jgi:hypothetical protein
MSWWERVSWLLVVFVGSGLTAALTGRLVRRRHLRVGWAPVAVRALAPGSGVAAGRWALHRAHRDGSAPLLRQASVHASHRGTALLSLAPAGRPVSWREKLRLPVGAAEALPAGTSAGPVEIASSPEVVAWLRQQLGAGQ